MAGLAKSGSEILVNTITDGNQTDPTVTGLAGGGFAVHWSPDGNTSVRGRIFDANGNPITPDSFAQGAAFHSSLEPTSAALAGGGYVTFAYRGTLSGFAIEGREFTASGAVVRDLSGPSGMQYPQQVEVTALTSGKVVYSYTANGTDLDILGNIVTLDGSAATIPLAVSTVTAGAQRNSEITALSGGGFVVVWEDNSGVGGDATGYGVIGQVFSAAGAKLGGEFLVNTAIAGDQKAPVVSALGSGFVVVWEDPSGTGADASGAAIRAQRFDASGGRIGGEILVNTSVLGDQVTPTVVQLPTGGFVVAWADASAQAGDTIGWAIRAQRFDSAGIKVGDELLVNTTTTGDQIAPAISVAGDGKLVVTWQDSSATGGDTSGTAIRAQLLQLDNSNTVIGTAGDDVYFVDDRNDVIIEGSNQGNDIVYASVSYALAAGQHIERLSVDGWRTTYAINLSGNEFANAIYGNDGVNLIDGGGGADLMFGLGGNDAYIVDNAGDLVGENAGEGDDIVYARVNYTLAAGQHVERLSADGWRTTNSINLSGNELANTLYGNDGVNLLDGGGGTDLMFGLGGNDAYIVDRAGDIMVENAGEGDDIVYARVDYTLAAGQHLERLSVDGWRTTYAIDLTGNGFANTLYGNDGANTLNGGAGADVMIGFAGADTFAFTTALSGGNVDVIADFIHGQDHIALDDSVFAGLAPGPLSAGAFTTGAFARDADDRIIYDSATGNLLFDADGSGSGAAILFGALQSGLAISATDFVVI